MTLIDMLSLVTLILDMRSLNLLQIDSLRVLLKLKSGPTRSILLLLVDLCQNLADLSF